MNSLVIQPFLSELFGSVWNTGSLTSSQWQGVMSALNDPLSDEEEVIVSRLIHAVHRGWVKVLD